MLIEMQPTTGAAVPERSTVTRTSRTGFAAAPLDDVAGEFQLGTTGKVLTLSDVDKLYRRDLYAASVY